MSATQTAIDWDAWRTAYPTMTYADHQAFYSTVYAQYPDQHHYDVDHVQRTIDQIAPDTVVELGGWDGKLAAAMLDHDPDIKRWTNIEICAEAARAGNGRHPKYYAVELAGWYWDHGPWHTDLFIASHTIEHLSAYHLERTIAATQAQAIFFDAPLTEDLTDWQGFNGSHILNIGWNHIDPVLNSYGYTLDWKHDRISRGSGSHARACLYLNTNPQG
jgi:hypothetical protein